MFQGQQLPPGIYGDRHPTANQLLFLAYHRTDFLLEFFLVQDQIGIKLNEPDSLNGF